MRARAVTRHARPYVLKFTRRRARRACSPRPVGAYGRGRTGHCRISRHPAPATRLDERTGAFSALLPRTSSAPGHLNSSDHRGSGSSTRLRRLQRSQYGCSSWRRHRRCQRGARREWTLGLHGAHCATKTQLRRDGTCRCRHWHDCQCRLIRWLQRRGGGRRRQRARGEARRWRRA